MSRVPQNHSRSIGEVDHREQSMIYTRFFMRVLIAALMFTLCGVPELVAQTTQTSDPAASNSQTQSQNNNSNQGSSTDPRFSGTRPDPSAGPQTPTLSPQVPESPSPVQPQQEQQQLPTAPSSTRPAQPVTQRENPAGAAAAEKGVTRGGAASKPAGTAIAPAKQRQVRSLLIKLGVLAAAGVAVGTVMGLSKGSPTSPPGASKASTASR